MHKTQYRIHQKVEYNLNPPSSGNNCFVRFVARISIAGNQGITNNMTHTHTHTHTHTNVLVAVGCFEGEELCSRHFTKQDM